MATSKILVSIIFILSSITVFGQGNDNLYVIDRNDTWLIQHKVKGGETLFSLARRFHIPPAILASANRLPYTQNFAYVDSVLIPVSAYNFVKDKPAQMTDARPIYYKIQNGEDNLRRASRNSGISQRTLADLNNLPDNRVSAGQVVLVGWVLYDATPMPTADANAPKRKIQVVTEAPPPVTVNAPQTYTPPPPTATADNLQTPDTGTTILTDTARKTPSDLENTFMLQTNNGENVLTEKGPAVFFEKASRGTMFYAFHSTAPRGTIIKVFNPGNGKSIYVKVIGPIPETKLYANSIIGISSGAREALGVRDTKMWCELTYVAN